MTDRPDPRLDALPYLPLNVPTAPRLLRDIDAADRAAGIVRVDTRDEALVERLVARQSHADWCCTKGCVEDRKMHRDVYPSLPQMASNGNLRSPPGTPRMLRSMRRPHLNLQLPLRIPRRAVAPTATEAASRSAASSSGEYPCPGTCTCEVDGITRAVLAALQKETQ